MSAATDLTALAAEIEELYERATSDLGEEASATVEEALALLDEHGIAVAPGSIFGAGGEGHVRVALVPTPEECRRAAERLASAR